MDRAGEDEFLDTTSRQAIELALDAGRMGVFSWDAVNDVVVWDQRIATLFGLGNAEFGGRYADWVASLHPDDRAHATSTVERSLQTGESFDFEHRVVHPDGSERWLEGRGQGVVVDGRVVGIRGVTVDITARKHVELELAAAQRRLGLLARVGEALGSTLDTPVAVRRLADVLVPEMGDNFEVALLTEHGELHRLVVVGPDADWAARRRGTTVPLTTMHTFGRSVRDAEVLHVRAEEEPELFGSPDDPTTAASVGVRERIIVPLFEAAGGDMRRVVGVLSVGLASSSRTFDGADVEFVTQIGGRVGVAMERGRSYERERVVAERLQHALLPDAVPVVAGVDIAVRYRPSTAGVQVGGDWYDVVETATGVWISVGDVVGHGVEAAAFMGRARAMLRALTVDEHLPQRALSRLDAAVFAMPDDPFVTVVLAHVEIKSGSIALALAGHPPAVVVSPDGTTTLIGRPQPPIGAHGDHSYEGDHFIVALGSLLVFFTDGLVERRGEVIDDGFDRLAAALEPWAGSDEVEAIADDLLLRLGAEQTHDDLALVIVRIAPD